MTKFKLLRKTFKLQLGQNNFIFFLFNTLNFLINFLHYLNILLLDLKAKSFIKILFLNKLYY